MIHNITEAVVGVGVALLLKRQRLSIGIIGQEEAVVDHLIQQ
jgi:hypothetical protein